MYFAALFVIVLLLIMPVVHLILTSICVHVYKLDVTGLCWLDVNCMHLHLQFDVTPCTNSITGCSNYVLYVLNEQFVVYLRGISPWWHVQFNSCPFLVPLCLQLLRPNSIGPTYWKCLLHAFFMFLT